MDLVAGALQDFEQDEVADQQRFAGHRVLQLGGGGRCHDQNVLYPRGMSPEPLPQLEDLASLYRRAFREYGASALWSSTPVPDPTAADALAITRSLRVEGDRNARRLAEQIEQACRAAP
jgi:hypothetical protein